MTRSWQAIRILIVDDHPVVRHGLLSLFVGHQDIEVIGEAENGAQVLPFLAENEIDLILLDIKMKGQSGIEIARRVRISYPHVKVIILTTYGDETYLHEALEAGVHGFLLKSVSHEILPDSIRAVMKGERLVSPSLVSGVIKNYQALAQEQAKLKAGLTKRDLSILSAIAEGSSTKKISEELFLSEATVKRNVQEILEKLDASNRAQAIAEAVRRGWIR